MTRITTKVEMEFNEGWTTPDVKGPVKKRPERGGGRAGDGDKVREFRKVLVDNSRVMKGVMVMRNGDPKRGPARKTGWNRTKPELLETTSEGMEVVMGRNGSEELLCERDERSKQTAQTGDLENTVIY
ncbi:hypothetical protein DFH09DRAFT_1067406 [Mycena vulgaris]|nr:hypothetical protein DFH09DRAFT_1067406 [Mycena vulgaris]